MSLKTLRDSFHSHFLEARNIDLILLGEDFEIAYNSATDKEKGELYEALKQFNKRALKQFIDGQLSKLTPFHKMSIRRLREIGKNLKVSFYWRKNKLTLLREILDVTKRLKKSG